MHKITKPSGTPKLFYLVRRYIIQMSTESEDDEPRPPKTRGEVYAQEQARIAEERKE